MRMMQMLSISMLIYEIHLVFDVNIEREPYASRLILIINVTLEMSEISHSEHITIIYIIYFYNQRETTLHT